MAPEKKQWTIAICSGCGGIFAGIGLPACSCEGAHAKTGKKVTVIPADSPNVLSEEEARLLFTDRMRLSGGDALDRDALLSRLKRFAEGSTHV